jgi:hypothetical protein
MSTSWIRALNAVTAWYRTEHSSSITITIKYRSGIISIEHHSVCPLVWIGSAHPLSRKRVCLTEPKGGAPSAWGWGGGGPNSDDWRESLALCLHCAMRMGLRRAKCCYYYKMKNDSNSQRFKLCDTHFLFVYTDKKVICLHRKFVFLAGSLPCFGPTPPPPSTTPPGWRSSRSTAGERLLLFR